MWKKTILQICGELKDKPWSRAPSSFFIAAGGQNFLCYHVHVVSFLTTTSAVCWSLSVDLFMERVDQWFPTWFHLESFSHHFLLNPCYQNGFWVYTSNFCLSELELCVINRASCDDASLCDWWRFDSRRCSYLTAPTATLIPSVTRLLSSTCIYSWQRFDKAAGGCQGSAKPSWSPLLHLSHRCAGLSAAPSLRHSLWTLW